MGTYVKQMEGEIVGSASEGVGGITRFVDKPGNTGFVGPVGTQATAQGFGSVLEGTIFGLPKWMVILGLVGAAWYFTKGRK